MAAPAAIHERIDLGGIDPAARLQLREMLAGLTPDLREPDGVALELSVLAVAMALEDDGVETDLLHGVGEQMRNPGVALDPVGPTVEDITRIVDSFPNASGIHILGQYVGIDFGASMQDPVPGPYPQAALF